MAYTPIKTRMAGQVAATSLMGKKGLNLRDLSQLLSPDYAISIKNYYVTSDGGLTKRDGMSLYFDRSSVVPITMVASYASYVLVGYGTKLDAYNIDTAAVTNIKTYTTSGTFSGQRAGDYFLVTNGTEAIGRVSLTLAYDAQSANFTVGKTLTGATSGATAIILEDADSGVTGTLTLGSISGAFVDNEIITDNNGTPGSATANGVITFAYASISGSPIATVLKVLGNRLYAVVGSKIQYSSVDDGTNPPFSTWSTGTNASDAGVVQFRNAGQINAIEGLGNNVLALADNGKWAFQTTTIDSAGTLKKVDQTIINRIDIGGSRASLSTDKGVFYANEAGLWQLTSIGQPNIPFSDQEAVTSKLLGNHYFDNVNLDNADLAYLPQLNLVLLTCGKDSATNNHVIVYNTETKAFSFFTGWQINRFLNLNQTLYGCGSTTAKVWILLDGQSDDGEDIWTEFEQEIKIGQLNTNQSINKLWVQGALSSSSSIDISFNIYDITGNYVSNKVNAPWTPTSSVGGGGGFGVSGWGSTAWGGADPSGDLIDSFDGWSVRIQNFQRIRIRFSENSKVPHIINWFSLEGRVKSKIRRRHIN